MEHTRYCLKDPYPVPSDLRPNRKKARILQASYSGPESELTAIMQYIYQHLEVKACHEEAAHMLEEIAIVEMTHLDMLGTCVQQLGLPPSYRFFRNNQPHCWNASFVPYGGTLREMICVNIQSEHTAIRNYKTAIHCLEDEQLTALLERIIRDEEMHIEAFEAMLQQL